MNPPSPEDTQKIHAAYCRLTGLALPLTMAATFQWQAFLARGFSEPDLACLVRYLKRRINKRERKPEALSMRNLIADLDYFTEQLADARAESRADTERNQNVAKASVLAATGRSLPEKQAMTPAQVMEQSELMASMLKEWRQTNL